MGGLDPGSWPNGQGSAPQNPRSFLLLCFQKNFFLSCVLNGVTGATLISSRFFGPQVVVRTILGSGTSKGYVGGRHATVGARRSCHLSDDSAQKHHIVRTP